MTIEMTRQGKTVWVEVFQVLKIIGNTKPQHMVNGHAVSESNWNKVAQMARDGQRHVVISEND